MMHQVNGSSSDECKHAERESQSQHSCVWRCTTVLGDDNRCGRPSTGPADRSSDRHASRSLRSIARTCYWEQMPFTCKTRISPPLRLGMRSQGKYLWACQSPRSSIMRLGWSEVKGEGATVDSPIRGPVMMFHPIRRSYCPCEACFIKIETVKCHYQQGSGKTSPVLVSDWVHVRGQVKSWCAWKERPITVKYGRNLAELCCWGKKIYCANRVEDWKWWTKTKNYVRKLAKLPQWHLILTGVRIPDPFSSKLRFETSDGKKKKKCPTMTNSTFS